MFQNDYRREMDRLAPSQAALERLNTLLEAGARPPRRSRQGRRRVAAAVGLCAVLAVSALAAGPTLWAQLEQHLGGFAPYVQPMEGTVLEQGIRVELQSGIADGAGFRVYATLTDLEGGRLNDHTTVRARLRSDGEDEIAVSCHTLEWEEESHTLLLELEQDTEQLPKDGLELVLTGIDSAEHWEEETYFAPPETARTLESTGNGADEVLLPDQTPQTHPDAPDYSVSSIGFGRDGCLHVRLRRESERQCEGMAVIPMDQDGVPLSSCRTLALEDGWECVLEEISPQRLSEVHTLAVNASYSSGESALQGEWVLPLELERARERIISLDPKQTGGYAREVRISCLGVTVVGNAAEPLEQIQPVEVFRKDGSALQSVSLMATQDRNGTRWEVWRFEEPITLETIARITVGGTSVILR